jgi:hypothetical protein
VTSDVLDPVDVGEVDDEGVVGGTALRGEDPRDGVRVAGVRAEAVDRLGRERDELAGAQRLRRPLQAGVVRDGERARQGGVLLDGGGRREVAGRRRQQRRKRWDDAGRGVTGRCGLGACSASGAGT